MTLPQAQTTPRPLRLEQALLIRLEDAERRLYEMEEFCQNLLSRMDHLEQERVNGWVRATSANWMDTVRALRERAAQLDDPPQE